ncbi:MAG: hypothetical protein GYA31_00770 [Parcubacteria group bacterium]|nr:hypothetical protein [Parcubacteria group bacterium]
MIEFYKKDDQIFKVDDAGIVKGEVNKEDIPEGAKIIEKPQEEDDKIPTEEGALFKHKETIFIIKNGTVVRATEKEIQKYYEQSQKNLEKD